MRFGSAAAERLERLELSEIYRSNAKRRACLILFSGREGAEFSLQTNCRDRANTLNIRNRQLSQETQFAKFDLIRAASILRGNGTYVTSARGACGSS